MLGIFNPENRINIAIGKIGDLIFINLLFIVCCIPFVTVGASLSAMHFCCLKLVKGDLDGVTKTFFCAFKTNFKQATLTWIFIVLGTIFLLTGINFLKSMSGGFATVYLYFYYAVGILLLLFTIYIFPVIATFKNKLKQLYIMAFSFCFIHFPKTIAITFCLVFPFVFTYSDLDLLALYAFIWAICGFSLICLLADFLFYRIFKKYLPVEETENEQN